MTASIGRRTGRTVRTVFFVISMFPLFPKLKQTGPARFIMVRTVARHMFRQGEMVVLVGRNLKS